MLKTKAQLMGNLREPRQQPLVAALSHWVSMPERCPQRLARRLKESTFLDRRAIGRSMPLIRRWCGKDHVRSELANWPQIVKASDGAINWQRELFGQPRVRHSNLGTSGIGVSVLGLGCMAMANAYGAVGVDDANDTLRKALDLGVNHFDTADVYANGSNERLLAQLLRSRGDDMVIATKGGATRTADNTASNDGSPKYLRRACEASLKRLGIDYIDLYYLHRVDPQVPIEESVGALADLVKDGKVRAVGLSEVAPATLRRAHCIHPIAALQTELSLGFQDANREILPLCRELGIAFVAYSPLGRGLWSGAIRSKHAFEPGHIHANIPRFSEANMTVNLVLVDSLNRIAASEGITIARLSLAWVLSRGDHVVAIPGTRSPERLAENIAAGGHRLSAQTHAALDKFPFADVQGARHTQYKLSRINLE